MAQNTSPQPPILQKNTGRPRGKYTTKACEECRRRRAKCDGKKPSCSRCLQWQISCAYSDADTSRKPASKKYVLELRQRIESLEQLLKKHGIDPQESTEPKWWSSSSLSGPTGGEARDPTVEELTESWGKLALDESLNFDRDGEMRYFGRTSGRLEFPPSSDTLQTEVSASIVAPVAALDWESESVYHLYDRVVIEVGVSKSIQEELLNLYFTWENPWFAVVDEMLYYEGINSGSQYCSPLLHYCILAVGSLYSHKIDVRSDPNDPKTAGDIFVAKAKGYLYKSIESPSLTTVQAVTIIGTYYIAIGGDASCWLHHGMANRLVLDLGLNLDPAGFEETKTLSHREIQLRRQIYWALYCHDKWSSSYTGRVCSMLDSQGAVRVPEDDENEESSPAETSTQRAFRPLQRAMAGICLIQEKMILSLWAPKPLLNAKQRPAFLKSCLLDLRSWLYDLPTELRIDRPNSIPQAYTLHMIYYTARILLAEPYSKTPQSKEDDSQTPNETANLALDVCRESARAICLVAQKYRQIFGSFERSPISATHCTLSAALVLLRETEMLSTASHKAKLNICVTVLDELSKTWHPARAIGRSVRKLCFMATSDVIFASEDNYEIALDQEFPDIFAEIESSLQFEQQTSDLNEDPSILDILPFNYEFFDMMNQVVWDQI
ncbi:Zn(II)2Cys6 transcription factor [Aspergillus steynii IBT 23096]|uniref:Zn(II)2Cys6 transcription factor n=1 Tax=Aspergillus steynii IBT 23096 TaxID=1392250 RepID=A0A2I2GAM4_9EURO|nr:Zn(II)2Cys6 transcription factor [Aspergillus steynii IBT 23096]PLB49929.1 Zn(II)2Cys6 transcription factor [Aspergillus steynii IBT 23096]